MSAKRVVILCEGPDDVAALRELLLRNWGFSSTPQRATGPAVGDCPQQDLHGNDIDLTIVRAGGRAKLHTAWVQLVRGASPGGPGIEVGVCFDPDADDEGTWRRTVFEEPWGAGLERDGEDYIVATQVHPPQPKVHVVPLPWSSDAPDFDQLDPMPQQGQRPKQCLERLLVAAANAGRPGLGKRLVRWMAELRESGEATPTWKTAARLWHATLFPEIGVPSVAEKVLGQDHDLAEHAIPLVKTSPVWEGLKRILGAPAPKVTQ